MLATAVGKLEIRRSCSQAFTGGLSYVGNCLRTTVEAIEDRTRGRTCHGGNRLFSASGWGQVRLLRYRAGLATLALGRFANAMTRSLQAVWLFAGQWESKKKLGQPKLTEFHPPGHAKHIFVR